MKRLIGRIFFVMFFMFMGLYLQAQTIQQLTTSTVDEQIYCWSPDGSKIAYVSDSDSDEIFELWLINADGTNQSQLFIGVRNTNIDWNGDYILFTKKSFSTVTPPTYVGDGELWKIKSDGSEIIQITFTSTNGIDQHCWGQNNYGTVLLGRFSPDGSKVAFVAHHCNGWFDPFVCNSDGSDQYVLLYDTPGNNHCDDITWSSDGTIVLYANASNWYENHNITSVDPITGMGDVGLASSLPYNLEYGWSPNGTKILFSTGPSSDRNISIMNPDGSGQVELVNDSDDQFFGDLDNTSFFQDKMWHPDGSKFVFSSKSGDNSDIYTINADGTELSQLTTDAAHDYNATFSADGSKIAFISERSGNRDIYIMTFDDILFYEDFSGDLSAWNFWYQSGHNIEIRTDDGNPPPCLLLDDYLNFGTFGVSNQTFSYVGKTIEFSADMKQGNASFSDQRYSSFALSKQNVHGDVFCGIIVIASSNPIYPNTVVCRLLYDDNGTETSEESGYLPIPDGDGWHNGKIKISSNGTVEFFLDNSLVYTSINEITTAYDGQAAVEIGCRKSLYDNVLVAEIESVWINADFSADITEGDAPLEVIFTDESTVNGTTITSWEWDFGDGYTSIEPSPTHIYETAGIYDVTLIVSDGTISDTLTKADYITVHFDVDFSAVPTSGYSPLVVDFSDLTIGNPTSWDWDYGDGNVSSEQNPAHTFWNSGTYDITLIVSNATMIDTLTKPAYITIDGLPAPLDEPQIYRIDDIQNDQGHNVRLYWIKSLKDADSGYPWILFYSIWRRIDDLPEDDGIINLNSEKDLSKYIQDDFDNNRFIIPDIDNDYWEGVGTVGAIHLDWYSFVSPTLVDSGSTGINWSVFKVYAHTNINTFYESLPDSSYSIDNIPPNPTDEVYVFVNGGNIELSWNEITDGSYQGNSYPELNGVWYKIHASDDPYFDCDETNLIDTISNPEYDYPLGIENKKFFKIVVSDQP